MNPTHQVTRFPPRACRVQPEEMRTIHPSAYQNTPEISLEHQILATHDTNTGRVCLSLHKCLLSTYDMPAPMTRQSDCHTSRGGPSGSPAVALGKPAQIPFCNSSSLP